MGLETSLTRMLYPNWFSTSFFLEGWGFFFHQELYNLSLLILIDLTIQFIFGFSWSCFLSEVFIIIAVRRFLAGGICNSNKKLKNQTVIITGANCGIGKETVRDMLRRGAHVILACRSVSKAEEAKRELLEEGGKVEVRQLDLSSLQSVRDFAAGIKKDNIKVHILINNAGVMMCPYMETAEGFELQMGTNHLGHFLLTNLLLPQMMHGEPARIVNLSSLAHLRGKINFDDFNYKQGYNKQQAYGNSKLANVLFTTQLAKVLKGNNIQVFSVHPGLVYSNLGRHLFDNFFTNYLFCVLLKTTMEGAQTTIYCATEAKQDPKMYFSDCAVGWPLPEAIDESLAEIFWQRSVELVDLKN